MGQTDSHSLSPDSHRAPWLGRVQASFLLTESSPGPITLFPCHQHNVTMGGTASRQGLPQPACPCPRRSTQHVPRFWGPVCLSCGPLTPLGHRCRHTLTTEMWGMPHVPGQSPGEHTGPRPRAQASGTRSLALPQKSSPVSISEASESAFPQEWNHLEVKSICCQLTLQPGGRQSQGWGHESHPLWQEKGGVCHPAGPPRLHST